MGALQQKIQLLVGGSHESANFQTNFADQLVTVLLLQRVAVLVLEYFHNNLLDNFKHVVDVNGGCPNRVLRVPNQFLRGKQGDESTQRSDWIAQTFHTQLFLSFSPSLHSIPMRKSFVFLIINGDSP